MLFRFPFPDKVKFRCIALFEELSHAIPGSKTSQADCEASNEELVRFCGGKSIGDSGLDQVSDNNPVHSKNTGLNYGNHSHHVLVPQGKNGCMARCICGAQSTEEDCKGTAQAGEESWIVRRHLLVVI